MPITRSGYTQPKRDGSTRAYRRTGSAGRLRGIPAIGPNCPGHIRDTDPLNTIIRRERIDYLEATLLMFVRDLVGKHEVGFEAAIRELARVARDPSDPPVYHAHTTDEEPTRT